MEKASEKKEQKQTILLKLSENSSKIIRKQQFVTNLFPVSIKSKKQLIYQYHITLTPAIEEKDIQLLYTMVDNQKEQITQEFGTPNYVSGYELFASKENTNDVKIVYKKDASEYLLSFTKVRDWDPNNLSLTSDDKDARKFLQMWNIQFKKLIKEQKLVQLGRVAKYFDTKNVTKMTIEQRDQNPLQLNVFTGYKITLALKDKLFLNIDFASRLTREETALDFIYNFQSDLEARENMANLSVFAPYDKQGGRIYKIIDLDLTKNPKSTFQTKEGQEISFVEYYQKTYKLAIKDMKQPLILSEIKQRKGDARKVYLIPELVKMTGITDEQKANFRVMQKIAEVTKKTPEQRYNIILDQVSSFSKKLQQSGFSLETKSIVQGGEINMPTITLGSGQKIQLENSGSMIIKEPILQKHKFEKEKWLLIYNSRGKQDDGDIDYLVDTIKKAAQTYGIIIEDPAFLTVKSTKAEDWINTLQKDIDQNGMPDLMMTCIPSRFKAVLYPRLKHFCLSQEAKIGVPHQNVVIDNFNKNKSQMGMASKIALQMVCKIGKPLWKIQKPVFFENSQDKTMIMGIDFYKKSIKRNKKDTFCVGLVSTTDKDFTKYCSTALFPPKGESNQADAQLQLSSAIQKQIATYFKVNKYPPERIIIFRDGVGESQIKSLDNEIEAIKGSFKKINEKYSPKLIYIMINKKNSIKIFSESQEQSGRQEKKGGKYQQQQQYSNPASGSIVYDEITSKNEFLLIPQKVTQGCCTPTQFTILHNDDPQITLDTIYQLTFYQCFNYYNWQGAVRVPAQVQLAHKLAFLIGDTFQSTVDDHLEQVIYWL